MRRPVVTTRMFFVMSQTLDAFDCEVQTYEDSPCPPHAFVSLTLKKFRKEPYIWMEKGPQAFPLEVP